MNISAWQTELGRVPRLSLCVTPLSSFRPWTCSQLQPSLDLTRFAPTPRPCNSPRNSTPPHHRLKTVLLVTSIFVLAHQPSPRPTSSQGLSWPYWELAQPFSVGQQHSRVTQYQQQWIGAKSK
ncbi:hypothetical protein BDN72DRAFT_685475 [Pluteus cervinus]|uniref:Uncharacterized protein n=1 Tax=Pluteus cervinus TaxID=181527 RepID=A0ACD3AQU7_9AGAR|nr:hypothetical protein BDN72DRAFT_685475 [Pluteus cervinus]